MARRSWKKPAWLKEKIAMDKSMQSRQEDGDFYLIDKYPLRVGLLLKATRGARKAMRRLGIRV